MKKTLPAANRSTVRPHLNTACRKTVPAARAGRALPRVPLMAAAVPEKHPLAAESCAAAPAIAARAGRALPRVPLAPAAVPEKHPLAAESCAAEPVPAPVHTPPEATTPGLPPATLAAAVRNGVVLRSAADRSALFAHWLAPHLPMVHGIVRRHSYFASELADNYQSAVVHLLEHLDALAHFALRCARLPHSVADTAASAVADTVDDADAPTDSLPEVPTRADDTEDDVDVPTDSLPEMPPRADDTVDDADAPTDSLPEMPPRADDTEERTEPLRPVVVTADAVMHTARAVDPRPWLAGVTLRLLSTLNGRALRHRATHLTPASGASDEPFDPADPDGGLAPTAGTDSAAGAQSNTAPAPQATPRATADSAPADGATPSPDDCLERWHREAPRPGFHRTGGGRLWKAMRERAQQAHSAFAYRAVLRADAAAALAALPLRDRALVLLTADGWTAEEIGQAIGTSPTAVRQTVCRVRLRLRQWRRDERKAHARRA